MKDILKTGVYKITNTVNGKFYIGSARLSFRARFNCHKSDLKYNKHRNVHLQRSYNIHGLNSFKFEILEICEGDENILDREQFFIDTLAPEFNLSTNVRQPALGRKASQEERDNMSKRMMGREPWNKGMTYPKEFCSHYSAAQKGKKNSKKGKFGISKRQVIRNDGKIYANVYEAALELDVKQNTIIKSISDKTIIRKVKGYTFKYL